MTSQDLKNARLENLAAYMAADSEADRVNIELVYSAAYAYLTGGVAPDPMTLPGAPTVFIVSQRAASLMATDQIIVLDDGKVMGIGSHRELLQTCPVYQEIYHSQFPKEAA